MYVSSLLCDLALQGAFFMNTGFGITAHYHICLRNNTREEIQNAVYIPLTLQLHNSSEVLVHLWDSVIDI